MEDTKPNQDLPDESSSGGEETPEGKTRPKKKRRFSWFRFTGRLFLVLGVLLGLVYLVAYFYFNSYLRKEIIRQVSAKTDSLYSLKIDYIGINLFTSTLQVKRAHFQKNPQKWDAFKQQYPDTNYLDMDARLDRLRITGIRWVHFLKTGEVKIKHIIFQKPKIRFHGKVRKKLSPKRIPQKKALEKQQKPPPKPVQVLAKALGKFASDLTIEKIKVEDGEIDFSNQSPRGKARHQLERFNTEVQKIRLIPQENLPDTQALQVKRFAFKAKKYAFTTPDQVYDISLEEFDLNSYDSTLQLAGIKVKPQFAEQNRLNNLKKHKATFVNVDLDSLTTNRLDLYRLITKQEISLGGLFVHSLQLEITRDQSMPRQIKQKKRNLKQILANLPLYIRADTLALKNASIKYLQKTPQQKNEPVVAHKADSIHLYLRHVALGKAADSATRDKLLYSESVDLEMRNYQHQTPDGLYKITLDKTLLSSRKSLVNIENASVKPQLAPQTFALRKFYRSVRVDAEVKSVQFTQLDIEKLVYNQEFLMQGLYINRPRFKAYTDKRLPKRPAQKYQNFEQMLQSLPLHVQVDTLAIRNASMEYVEQQTRKTKLGDGLAIHRAQNINLMVQRIQLGKALRGVALAGLDTRSLWIDVKNYRFKTPDGIYEMLFKDLEVSSARSRIEIDSLKLRPLLSDSAFVKATKYRKPLFNFALADVKAQEINFDKLLLYQEFDWGKLYLNRPQIDVFVDKRKPKKPVEADTLESAMEEPEDTVSLQVLLRNLPLYIKVDTFAINNARIRYREQVANATKNASGVNVHQVKRFDCMLPQIRLGRASREDSIVYDFYSPDIVVNLDDYEFREKNGVYKLSLKDLHSSFTDAQILLENIKLQPLISREEFSKREPSRKPLWDLSFKSISAHEIDLEKLIFNGQINLNALHLNQPNVKLYLDKLKPKDSTKTPKTIHQILREVPLPVKVDTFLIYDANFYLTEHRKKGNGEHRAEKINLISKNFYLAENREERQQSKDLLFMQDIFVNLSQYRYITPDQMHVISLNNVAAALSDSSLQLQHLSLKPRVSEQDFDSIKQYRALRVDAELAYFNAQKVDFRRLFNGQGIEMKRLNLDRLHLDFYQNNNLKVNPYRPYRTLQQQLASIPLYISVDSLRLTNSFANLRLLKGQGFRRHRADSILLTIRKFKLDSASRANPAIQKTLFADDVSCRLKNYQTQSPNKVYNIRAKQVNASTAAKTLKVQEFLFEPPMSDSIFNTYFKTQEDRFKIRSYRLWFRQFAFDPLIRKGEVHIGSMNVDRFMMDIFRDRRKPPRQNKALMLNDLVRKVPFLVKLDTLNVRNSFVLYGEKVPQGMGFGQVFFTNINLRATNIQTKAPDTNLTVIKANTKLMGRGFIETTVKIPLLAPDFECEYYGQMGKMEAKFFNTMITANDHIFIRRGQIRKVKFNVQVRDSLATGELLADYRKLKISVLRKKNHQRKRGLITFIANLIIKHTNNLTKKRYKKGKVKYQFRKGDEYQNSFVGVLWRALSTGLVDTIK